MDYQSREVTNLAKIGTIGLLIQALSSSVVHSTFPEFNKDGVKS